MNLIKDKSIIDLDPDIMEDTEDKA